MKANQNVKYISPYEVHGEEQQGGKKCDNKYQRNASAGSRTRVYCLEGNYPQRWTTNVMLC